MTEDYKAFYQGKKVLVAGGAGAIGGNLVCELAAAGADKVIVLDDLSSGMRQNLPSLPNILFVEGSVLNEEKLKRVFFEGTQLVFDLVALFANQNSIDHPESDLLISGLGTLKLLQYAHLAQVERFIYASSGCSIYGSNNHLPLKEESFSLHLSSPYQITKMLGELYCNFFYSYYGLKTVRSRLFNVYGPGEVPGQYRNVIANFIHWAKLGKPLPITGSGEETRDFTYVDDIVDGLMRAGYFESAIGQAFNLASGHETQILNLANKINELTGNRAGVTFTERRKWDTKGRLLASIECAKSLIGYEPRISIEEGLKETVHWFEQHWRWIRLYARFEPGVSSAVRSYCHDITPENFSSYPPEDML